MATFHASTRKQSLSYPRASDSWGGWGVGRAASLASRNLDKKHSIREGGGEGRARITLLTPSAFRMIREGGGEGKAQLTHASGVSQNKQQNKNGDSMIEIKMTTTQGRERGNKINNNNNIIYNNNIYNNSNTTTKPMFVF